jgi:hypothetical protein
MVNFHLMQRTSRTGCKTMLYPLLDTLTQPILTKVQTHLHRPIGFCFLNSSHPHLRSAKKWEIGGPFNGNRSNPSALTSAADWVNNGCTPDKICDIAPLFVHRGVRPDWSVYVFCRHRTTGAPIKVKVQTLAIPWKNDNDDEASLLKELQSHKARMIGYDFYGRVIFLFEEL